MHRDSKQTNDIRIHCPPMTKIKRSIVAASATLLATTISVSAQELPRFDVNSQCRRIAGVSGGYSETIFSGCMDMEQAASNNIKGSWYALPSVVREQCMRIAAVGGGGSYSILQGCVQMEMEAAEKNRSRQFRY
jgi:hypothetical protein